MKAWGLRSYEPLMPAEGFVLLGQASCMTLLEEWLIAPHPLGSAREAPSYGGSGLLSLALASASAKGQEGAKDPVRLSSARSMRLGRTPEPRAEAVACSGLA